MGKAISFCMVRLLFLLSFQIILYEMKDIIIKTFADLPKVDSFEGQDDLTEVVKQIANAVIGVLGIVCVVVMIIGGVNYMTSSGDTSKVEKGKKTILYATIGLAICVLAFAIVNFVINNIKRFSVFK